MVWRAGNIYKGNWKSDLMNDYGELTFPNGNVYKGNFIDGDMDG